MVWWVLLFLFLLLLVLLLLWFNSEIQYDEHIPVQDSILQYGVNITAQRLATPFNLLRQSFVYMSI